MTSKRTRLTNLTFDQRNSLGIEEKRTVDERSIIGKSIAFWANVGTVRRGGVTQWSAARSENVNGPQSHPRIVIYPHPELRVHSSIRPHSPLQCSLRCLPSSPAAVVISRLRWRLQPCTVASVRRWAASRSPDRLRRAATLAASRPSDAVGTCQMRRGWGS